VHAFDVLGDPVRRRILELLVSGEQPAGAIVEIIQKEFSISQAAVSQHLKVLRDSGFAFVRIDGARRIYSVNSTPLKEIDTWLDQFRGFWGKHLNALTAEIARGKRQKHS
jgi:DNA-binding transcriptional ArsR family regulator